MGPADGLPVPPPFLKPEPSLLSYAGHRPHQRVGGLVDANQVAGPKLPPEPHGAIPPTPEIIDVPEREEFLVTWIRRVPGNATARTEYAEFLALQGRLDEALIQVTEALRLAPDDAENKAVLTLVLELRQTEDVKTGNSILARWYERKIAQAFPPMDALPRNEASVAPSTWDSEKTKLRLRFNVTREDLEKQYLPTPEEAMAWLAVRRYFDVKLLDDAEYAARRHRDRFPASPLAVARTSLAIFDLGKHAEAEKQLVAAVERYPKQLPPLVALEIVRQYRTQKWDLALWRSIHEFDVETMMLGFSEIEKMWKY